MRILNRDGSKERSMIDEWRSTQHRMLLASCMVETVVLKDYCDGLAGQNI